MADADSSTGVSASSLPLDELAFLADSYESLEILAFGEDGHNAPVPILLANLNKQLRHFLDKADGLGLLS